MTRLSGSANPMTSPLGKFAWELRSLRDQMGAEAPTVDEISGETGLPRSTLYSALGGHRLPRREVVAALARAWGGDESEWLSRRSEVERQLASGAVGPVRRRRDSVLSPGTVDLMRSAGMLLRYEPGSVLFRQDQLSHGVGLIERGLVKVVAHSPEGRETLLSIRGDGDLVGVSSAVDMRPHSTSVVALAPLDVRWMSSARWTQLIENGPAVSAELTRVLVDRLRESTRWRLDLEMTPADRVLIFLRRLGDEWGVDLPDGSIEIGVPLAQMDVASAVGASVKTVAQVFAVLRSDGLIATGRRRIVLLPRSMERSARG